MALSDLKILSPLDKLRLSKINNMYINDIIEKYILLCKPDSVMIVTDSDEDLEMIRAMAVDEQEEYALNTQGHTVHFDGYYDQARDKKHTYILPENGNHLGTHINTRPREEGLTEIMEIMDGIMKGKIMLVRFFCLGPKNSQFAIPSLQITDSPYVAHSEDILYRPGFEEFKRLKGSNEFFHFIHSAGQLDENHVTKDIEKRRIYIDLKDNRVLSVVNQYAGNSLGLKKLAFRLAINKAHKEKWLAEHMFIMGIRPENKERVTYFTGAFPSACGKTSTAMISGQTIVGDDIAYLKVIKNECRAVNIESGIFGIIRSVNPYDDPEIYNCLTSPRELIFSNVLEYNGEPYWLDMDTGKMPEKGRNHFGQWQNGIEDKEGKKVLMASKNARYTLRISELSNVDPEVENPNGVKIDGVIYGGRDADTNVPIFQSFSWKHGVFLGSSIESVTTAATIGKEGQRIIVPMANLDFIVVPMNEYIQNYLNFGESIEKIPVIFATNYFLQNDEGEFHNSKLDKKIWLLWAEGRLHNEYNAIETPVGFIPIYHDLKELFKQVLNKDYSKKEYVDQFSIRLKKLLEKYKRVEKYYFDKNMPEDFVFQLEEQINKLNKVNKNYQKEIISPFEF